MSARSLRDDWYVDSALLNVSARVEEVMRIWCGDDTLTSVDRVDPRVLVGCMLRSPSGSQRPLVMIQAEVRLLLRVLDCSVWFNKALGWECYSLSYVTQDTSSGIVFPLSDKYGGWSEGGWNGGGVEGTEAHH